MADEASGQEPGTQQPTGQEQGGGDGKGKPAGSGDGKPGLTPEQMAAELKSVRDEAARYRTQLRDAEGRLQTFENEKLTESEKLQKRLADMEAAQSAWQTERQELMARSTVTEAASKAGALHPDAVFKLVDLAALEYDGAGRPTNVDKAVEDVAKAYPALFKPNGNGSADGGARGGVPKTSSMNDWLRGKTALSQ